MAERIETASFERVAENKKAILRITKDDLKALEKHLYRRYPDREWGTFIKLGYRRTAWGIALSFVESVLPGPDDLERNVGLTRFNDQYIRRAFKEAESQPLAIGVVHSHPQGYATYPSLLDDDMDAYFARELSSFGKGAPYCSLILQKGTSGETTFTARVYDKGEWMHVESLIVIGDEITRLTSEASLEPDVELDELALRERVESLVGRKSLRRLCNATVGIIGCSGTGSPAVHALVRGGIRNFVVVDPERLARSNLERLHGSTFADTIASPAPYKVLLMERLIKSISPNASVTAIVGNVLQENVLDELLRCDMLLGCVDTQHGRAAFSDIARHFLIPCIDMGIRMEGKNGRLTNQLAEFNLWTPPLGCAYCHDRINSRILAQEMMNREECDRRQEEARKAKDRGDSPEAYWLEEPQFHTVGYMTSMVGALGAGYLEGMLTGAFAMPHHSMQFDIGAPSFGMIPLERQRKESCSCSQHIGWGNQASGFRNVYLPPHWDKRGMLVSSAS